MANLNPFKKGGSKDTRASTRERASNTKGDVAVKRYADMIKRPRITEKASLNSEANVYTFEVDARANKLVVKKAIEELYSVQPLHVNIVSIPKKNVRIRGKKGVRGGGKKAYVYLKKDDTIEFV